MLDHFMIGRVTRISPEAPVPVVEFEHESAVPGGAANVAHNARALGAAVSLIGVVGRRRRGRATCAVCSRRASVPAHGLIADPARPTTRKMRIVTTRNQQVARIDYETRRRRRPARSRTRSSARLDDAAASAPTRSSCPTT